MTTVTLYRPVGPKELELIEASGWKRFPPRLPAQPIFYPVLNEEYAAKIAREWDVKESGVGIVTRFAVDADFVRRYPVHTVGSTICQELWVPAEELADFNDHIVGQIEVIDAFRKPEIRYLNTDLDLTSATDLTALAAAFEARGLLPFPVRRGENGLWYVTVEKLVDDIEQPEETIAGLLAVIEALEEPHRTTWSNCTLREFNIGYDCGPEPWAFNQSLSTKLL